MILHIDDFFRLRFPRDIQLSPDGSHIAFEMAEIGKLDKDTPTRSLIQMINIETGRVSIFAGMETTSTRSPRWSPDGNSLALISNRTNKNENQLYVMSAHGGEAQPLTDLRGSVGHLCWLNDGKSIAFLYSGTLDKEARKSPDPVVVDAEPEFDRIWVVDVASRELRAVTPEGLHIFEYALSPDDTHLAAVAHTHPNPAEGWYHAQIHITALASGKTQQVCTMPHQVGTLSWSPDGTRLACISGILSDQGFIGGDVYVIEVASGAIRPISEGIDHTPTWIEWRAEGILYGACHRDTTQLGWLDPETGMTREIWRGSLQTLDGTANRVSTTRNGNLFAARITGFSEPPNIYIGSLLGGDLRQIAELYPVGAFDKLPPPHAENIEWAAPDGLPIQGFVVYPEGYEPGKRYPLLLDIHGGPSGSFTPFYGLGGSIERIASALGCVVLLPNPRGSWGRGRAFQEANNGDLGGHDWQDINAGVDALVKRGIADADRLAVFGWSYGGYMTAWAITQTNRFKCAIAGAAITNYESNYGVVPIREWQTTCFGASFYDATDLHRERSPLTHVRKVRTPLLLVHGERDADVPVEQSIEFYTALKHFNVPVQLVIYPREPHGFRERAHQQDLARRIARWLIQYLDLSEDAVQF